MVEEKRICMECGKHFRVSEMLNVGRKMYCKECAEYILDEQNKTLKSGSQNGISIVNQQTTSIVNSASSNNKSIPIRNHKTAVILSIFLGWCGADRFYVGHTGLGILKLLTFGGYFIWWIIDIFLFISKNVNNVKWE